MPFLIATGNKHNQENLSSIDFILLTLKWDSIADLSCWAEWWYTGNNPLEVTHSSPLLSYLLPSLPPLDQMQNPQPPALRIRLSSESLLSPPDDWRDRFKHSELNLQCPAGSAHSFSHYIKLSFPVPAGEDQLSSCSGSCWTIHTQKGSVRTTQMPTPVESGSISASKGLKEF